MYNNNNNCTLTVTVTVTVTVTSPRTIRAHRSPQDIYAVCCWSLAQISLIYFSGY